MKMMISRVLVSSWFNALTWVVILLILSLSSSLGHSHITRGPHHPRNSPRVPPEQEHDHLHHHHYVPHKEDNVVQPKLTRDTQLLHDAEHLKEDMGEWVFADGKDLSPEEMEFHYFKMHDFDNNSQLDGLEILQAISHVLPMTDVETDFTKKAGGASAVVDADNSESSFIPLSLAEIESKRAELKKQKEDDFNYYIDLIDKVLEEDDINKDGYLSYAEYVVGRRRDEIEAKRKGPSN